MNHALLSDSEMVRWIDLYQNQEIIQSIHRHVYYNWDNCYVTSVRLLVKVQLQRQTAVTCVSKDWYATATLTTWCLWRGLCVTHLKIFVSLQCHIVSLTWNLGWGTWWPQLSAHDTNANGSSKNRHIGNSKWSILEVNSLTELKNSLEKGGHPFKIHELQRSNHSYTNTHITE